MMNYIDLNNLLSRMQSGLRPDHSRITALVDVSENIRQTLQNDDVNFLVLLDHSKAFDTVDHNMLIRKLKFNFRFSKISARLTHSYLSQCTQCVFLNGKSQRRQRMPLDKGVPQRSISHFFSPCMSMIYLNIF